MYGDQAEEFVCDIGDETVKNTQWFSYLKTLLVQLYDPWVTSSQNITNVQCWPQDPYFPFSSLVPHFSEVWKCGKVWQSQDNVTLFPWSYETTVILYLVPHFSELWKCGKVWQSQDIVSLFPQALTSCHSLLSSTLLRGVEVLEKSDKVRIMSHFSPDHTKPLSFFT